VNVSLVRLAALWAKEGYQVTTVKATVAVALRVAVATLVLLMPRIATAEIELAEKEGFKLTTDGRLNVFVSVSTGSQVPDTQPHPDSFDQYPGAGTDDQPDPNDKIQAVRIRNGFMPSILGFNIKKQVSETYAVSGRAALWMNVGAGRTKNIPGPIDPRELWVQVEGPWGALRGGSDLALFGRGGILVNYEISHNYGLGYPCTIENTAGGACGHVAFGAPFPGFEPGVVYTTPSFGGATLSAGVYDPVTIQNSSLLRTPLPRFEGELAFALEKTLKLFVNAHWQQLKGVWQLRDPVSQIREEEERTANAYGGQAGGMVQFGPVQAGGAAFTGAGLTPFTHVGEDLSNGDAEGKLRESMGFFGMGSFTVEATETKFAAGFGMMEMKKTENDAKPVVGLLASNPQVFRSNVGGSVGVYQKAGPVYFALEYFRAEHEWFEIGELREGRFDYTTAGDFDPNNLVVLDVQRPRQAVNFINIGMSLVW
jgi:hypothetical protein